MSSKTSVKVGYDSFVQEGRKGLLFYLEDDLKKRHTSTKYELLHQNSSDYENKALPCGSLF
jgi:hypothetical protein